MDNENPWVISLKKEGFSDAFRAAVGPTQSDMNTGALSPRLKLSKGI